MIGPGSFVSQGVGWEGEGDYEYDEDYQDENEDDAGLRLGATYAGRPCACGLLLALPWFPELAGGAG